MTSARVRSFLMWTMTWTFPVSAYLFAIGMTVVGVLYALSPERTPPADIIWFIDPLWGGLLIVAGVAQTYCMWREHPRWVRRLAAVVFLFAMSLLLASAMEGRPVSTIAATATVIYNAHLFLTAGLLIERKGKKPSNLTSR